MAQSSFPFENVDTTETQFSQMFRTINGGVNGTPSGTELKVTAGTGLQVSVALGQAMVRGHFYTSTAAELLTIGTANGSNPRIDSIVLTLDPTANSIVLAVVAGTPASSPVAPTLTQTDAGVYQYQLATVLVPAAAVAVSTITDTRSFMGDRFGIWSTASRPTDGKFRAGYNTTLNSPEFYNGSSWLQMATISGTETLTNKTLAAPVLTGITTAGDVYAANDFAAGKNKIINGGFDIWQRGTTSTASGYLADRFTFAGQNTFTQSRQAFTPGTAPVAGYEAQYYHNITLTSNNQNSELIQRVEDARTLAGQTVTFSFWARSTVGAQTMNVQVYQHFGTGGSPSSLVQTGISTTYTPTSIWTRYTFTGSFPSVAGKTFGTNNDSYLWVRIGQFTATTTNTSLDIWGVQLEAGSVATPFSRAGGTIQGELAACQRYYTRFDGANGAQALGTGVVNTTTRTNAVPIRSSVTMRTAPTAAYGGTVSIYDGSFSVSITSIAFTIAGNNGVQLDLGHSSTLTVGRPGIVAVGNGAGNWLELVAEL